MKVQTPIIERDNKKLKLLNIDLVYEKFYKQITEYHLSENHFNSFSEYMSHFIGVFRTLYSDDYIPFGVWSDTFTSKYYGGFKEKEIYKITLYLFERLYNEIFIYNKIHPNCDGEYNFPYGKWVFETYWNKK